VIAVAPRRAESAREVANHSLLVSAIIPAAVLAIVAAFSVAALDVPGSVFRSPDENASYIFTRALADTGKLWYKEDFLGGDEENLLHPRGAITHDGRAVPFNFLGLPVLYAPFYKVFGDDTRYIGVVIAVVTVWALASAGALLTKDRPWIAWLAVLALAPVIYQFGRPYLNVAPAVMFLSLGCHCFLRYVTGRATDRGWLALASIAFALAAFMRYELAVFSALLIAIGVLQKRRFAPREIALDGTVYAGCMIAFFGAPVLALNQYVYGSPTTYGYALFNEAYFPDREGAGGSVWALLTKLRSVALPSYPFDPELAARALVFQVGGVAPLFAIAAGTGLVALYRDRRIPVGFLAAYLALAAYAYVYRGAGESFLSDSATPSFEASVTRYALPVYLAAYLLVVYVASLTKRAELATGILVMLALVSIHGIVSDTEGNMLHVRNQVRLSDELARESLVGRTEPEAVIYTDVFDKVLSSYRDVAAWWGGSEGTLEGFFQSDEVAASMSRLLPSRPVYVYVAEEAYVIPRLDEALKDHGYRTEPTDLKRLYAVVKTSSIAGPSR
jgi:hypothetical protein